MATVYVLSKTGKPLMPTTRCGHVRLLLKQKRARVVNLKPFTIQLLYDCEEGIQPIVLGIDPGRTNIGLSAVRKDTGEPVFSAEMETRNKEIPKLMKDRKAFRQKHRSCGCRKVRQRRACAHNTISPKCAKQETAQNGGVSKQAQKVGVIKPKVMIASQGAHNGIPNYYRFTDGSRATPKNCKPIYQNSGIVFV